MENKDQYCIEVRLRDDVDDYYDDSIVSGEPMTLEDAHRALDQLEYTMRNHPVCS